MSRAKLVIALISGTFTAWAIGALFDYVCMSFHWSTGGLMMVYPTLTGIAGAASALLTITILGAWQPVARNRSLPQMQQPEPVRTQVPAKTKPIVEPVDQTAIDARPVSIVEPALPVADPAQATVPAADLPAAALDEPIALTPQPTEASKEQQL